MGVPLAVNPWPVHARLDLLEQAKVEYPKTWDEFIETSKKIQAPPRLFAFGMCLGLVADTTDNVMNLLWCYGGKMVEADNKTVVMNSPENVAGVKVIEAMFKTHKIIPPGRDLVGQLGQQQGLPVQAGRVRDEPVEHLRVPRRQRQGSPEGHRALPGSRRAEGHA